MPTAYVGSDHAAVELKAALAQALERAGWTVVDVGTSAGEPIDYPQPAGRVARAVASGEAALGVLACGTGIGVSIAANKVAGIRAALVSGPFSARMAREHNDANVLCFGARVTGVGLALAALEAFLAAAPSSEARHRRRIDGIHALEGGA